MKRTRRSSYLSLKNSPQRTYKSIKVNYFLRYYSFDVLSVLNALKIRITHDLRNIFGVRMSNIIMQIVLLDVLRMKVKRLILLKLDI